MAQAVQNANSGIKTRSALGGAGHSCQEAREPAKTSPMSQPEFRVRRATTDDFPALQSLWQSMRFASEDLEKRLTEFQVVETSDGRLVGAIGLQISGQHARLYNEGYTDFAFADAARTLFWNRIQTIAAHHGVFRLWTREQSPFWVRWGFQPPAADILERLPVEWRRIGEPWLTFPIKDEEALAAVDKEIAVFKEAEKRQTAETMAQAKALTTTITIAGLVIGSALIGLAVFMLIHRGLALPGH